MYNHATMETLVKPVDSGWKNRKVLIEWIFLPICDVDQQLHCLWHVHQSHTPLLKRAQARTTSHIHAVPSSCPAPTLSQLHPGSGLPVSPLTLFSSLGPLEEGGSSSDRTMLTALQPGPDAFLKAEPVHSHSSFFTDFSLISHSLF